MSSTPMTGVLVSSLPTTLPQRTCLRRGLCPVPARYPGAPFSHSIYYEQHGPPGTDRSKHKMVFITGLYTTCFSWEPQVQYFGNGGHEGDCTALVLDNTGVGNSGYTRRPYLASDMAKDIICLLDHLGWTEDRQLNITGVSMGGMIAQELAYLIPHRICSLVLAVTKPGGFLLSNIPPLSAVWGFLRLIFTFNPEKRNTLLIELLFPEKWLEERADHDPLASINDNTDKNEHGKTNYQVQKERLSFQLQTAKRQPILASIIQTIATLSYRISYRRMAYIAANVPKICIVSGKADCLIPSSGSHSIKAAMGRAVGEDEKSTNRVELVIWEGVGHGIHIQNSVQFNELVERCAREGRELLDNGWTGKHI